MNMVRKYIYEQVAAHSLSKEMAKKMLIELSDSTTNCEPIAIIGMSGRFPMAGNLEEYWQNIIEGFNCVGLPAKGRREMLQPFFPDRFASDLDERDVFEVKGYLPNIDLFDAEFFRISAREARCMDPLHRQFLEVAYETVEDAGHCKDSLQEKNVGVFVGNDVSKFSLFGSFLGNNEDMAVTGLYNAILASRLSYFLNLKGKCLVIDTACSSSLVALHEACQSLRNGDCDLALAGGVFLHDNIFKIENDPMQMILTTEKKIYTFDKNADGTLVGEGAGAVLLKPLSRAMEDGDSVYAVIKGSAINNDGASSGITAPNAEAQAEVLIKAWENAGISPEDLSFIEAHGTGTVLGDPIEIKAITKAFGKYTDKKQICGIGSVKTNIGHTVSASGMASLFKMVYAMRCCVLPGNINFQEPNPYIQFAECPVYVVDKNQPWNRGEKPRRCGISSFGFSGTNCHIVLEESPELQEEPIPNDGKGWNLFFITAKTYDSLVGLVDRYVKFFRNEKNLSLGDICYLTAVGRCHYEHRIVLALRTYDELIPSLENIAKALAAGRELAGVYGEHKVVSVKKQQLRSNEISDDSKRKLSQAANRLLEERVGPLSCFTDPPDELIKAYLQGADVEWRLLYQNQKHKRLHLPVYPYKHVRHWPMPSESDGVAGISKVKSHPLIDNCLAQSAFQDIYTTRFSSDSHWVLSEHIINNRRIMPGTAYLEMVHKALEPYKAQGNIAFKNVVFLTPFALEEGEHKEVHTILDKQAENMSFKVLSKWDDDSGVKWVCHAEGSIEFIDQAQEEKECLADILSRCGINDSLSKGQVTNHGFDESYFGSRWSETIKSITPGHDELLVELLLPAELEADIKVHTLHPSLLDNAVNAAIRYIGQEVYLPFSYRSIIIYDQIPAHFFSHVVKVSQNIKSDESATFDITLYTPKSKIIAIIRGYTIKKVDFAKMFVPAFGDKNYTYVIKHKKSELINGSIGAFQGKVLFIGNQTARAKGIAAELEKRGFEVTYIADSKNGIGENAVKPDPLVGEEYHTLLSDKAIKHVIHAATLLDAPKEKILDPDLFLDQGVYSFLRLLKAMDASGLNSVRVTVLSSGTNQVEQEEDGEIQPHNAALLGLCKTARHEFPDYACRFIDCGIASEAQYIVQDLLSADTQFLALYRNNHRYIEVMDWLPVPLSPNQGMSLNKDGFYLVTGGAKGVGLEVAKLLAGYGAANIAMIGRTEPNPVIFDGISAVEELGASVSYVQADVADERSLHNALMEFHNRFGTIRGIVHSAGVAGSGFLRSKSEEVLSSVLLPKVRGTFLLDKLTQESKLDFFVLFSSVVNLVGTPGQGDYITANSFMDSYAQCKRNEGKRFCAINWPVWKQTGMGVRYGLADQAWFFKPIDNKHGLEIFRAAIEADVPRVIVGEMDLEQMAAINVSDLLFSLSDDIKRYINAGQLTKGYKKVENKRDIIIRGRHDDDYSEYERGIAAVWGEVLERDIIDVYDDFYVLGGDSIIALRIVNNINEHFNTNINVSTIFEHSTIFDLGIHIQSLCGKQSDTATEMNGGQGILQRFYPLSHAQKRIWFLQRFEPDLYAYNLASEKIFIHQIDIDALKTAIVRTADIHPVLKIRISETDGLPEQFLSEDLNFDELLTVIDLSAHEDPLPVIDKMVDVEKKKPFDLSKPLFCVFLYKIKEGNAYLFMCIHHIITDGWSMQVVMRDIKFIYNGLAEGRDVLLPTQGKTYFEWIIENEKWESSDECNEMMTYWLEEMAKPIPVLGLPTDRKRPFRQTYTGSYVNFMLDAANTERVMGMSQNLKCTMHIFLLSVYFVLLEKLSGDQDIVIGIPISNRHDKNFENTAGMFINSICIRMKMNGDETLRHFIERVRAKSISAYKNGRFPFDRLVTEINPEREYSRNPLFSVMFQHYDHLPPSNDGISLFDISLLSRQDGDKLTFRMEYNQDIYDIGTVEKWAQYYLRLLTKFTESADIRLSELRLLSYEEQLALINDTNCVQTDVKFQGPIHSVFEEQAALNPYRTAILAENGQVTYHVLNSRANRLARYLRTLGVQQDTLVPVFAERSIEMVTAILAVMKAGGAYVPLDPTYPAERLSFILSDCGAKLLLAQEGKKVPPGLHNYCQVLDMADDEVWPEDDGNLGIDVHPNDAVYTFYTSGTTGQPKGVVIEHFALSNYMFARQKRYCLTADDVVMQRTQFTFDISVWELTWWFFANASLYLLKPGAERDPQQILDAVHKNKITIIQFVPSALEAFCVYLENSPDDISKFASVRWVFSCGEALTVAHVARFRKLFPDLSLTNLYGPTESTIDVSFYNCPVGEVPEVIPIGRPNDNIRLYILDRQLTPVVPGVAGELYIAGAGLARGYLKRPELSASSFVPDPFFDGEKMYRTGDMARWIQNNMVEFLGRKDNQVKIRGFRIELEEIEYYLKGIPGVEGAVVSVYRDQNNIDSLSAYIIGDSCVGKEQVQQSLMQDLPGYMIPSYIQYVDSFPLTCSGKIDKKRLPPPQGAVLPAKGKGRLPQGEIQVGIAKIWGEILGLKYNDLHVDESFFDIGGNSLVLVQMHARIEEIFPDVMRIMDIFDHPTIAMIARFIEQSGSPLKNQSEDQQEAGTWVQMDAQRVLDILTGQESN